ncbi:hypothetical protein XENTR_v10008205 [Xenopus tropicalis]|nr:hypothetical protein XENTR_v10008205 [Xenopus tropicalis]
MCCFLKLICVALCLFHLLGANPVPSSDVKQNSPLIETIKHLIHLLEECETTEINCNTTLLPVFYSGEKISTIAEISCKAVQSLDTIQNSKLESLKELYTSLIYQVPQDMKCKVAYSEAKDLRTAAVELLGFFRYCIRTLACN